MLIFDQHDILLRNMIYLTDVKCDIFGLRPNVAVTLQLIVMVYQQVLMQLLINQSKITREVI